MGKRIAIALLLLPVAEIAAFLLVVWAIGFFPALGLMILTSFAGALVLGHAGRGQIAHVGAAMRRRETARVSAETVGMVRALGGILLLLPGFITDLVGAGLLIGPVRRRIGAALGRATGAVQRNGGPDSVVDLAPDEWQSVPDQELPKPRPDSDHV